MQAGVLIAVCSPPSHHPKSQTKELKARFFREDPEENINSLTITILINHSYIFLYHREDNMGAQFSQVFPPRPGFQLEKLPSQKGKVFIVTGATSGIGFKVAETLYAKGGKVYIAGRSQKKGQDAIEAIQRTVPQSEGILEFIFLTLDDLTTIKDSVNVFRSKETKSLTMLVSHNRPLAVSQNKISSYNWLPIALDHSYSPNYCSHCFALLCQV